MNETYRLGDDLIVSRTTVKSCLKLVLRKKPLTEICEPIINFLESSNVTILPSNKSNIELIDVETNEIRPFLLSLWAQVFWIFLFGIMVITAIIGNLTVIWIIMMNKRMRSVTNYFLLNLSISDLIATTLNAVFNFVYLLQNHWPFGIFYCSFNNFIANLTVSSSVFTIAAVSIER